ncbi:MAG: Transcriptional regulator, IclR family [uncultured Caballeronia sp.]|nr:MAG: Transcriptional regulator, IclR family [uncultured Caballeronia sp.]
MTQMKEAYTPTLRTFALLEYLVAAEGPVSLADIAHDVGLPKASLHRMLASLEAGGLVIRAPDQKNAYVIGPRLTQLGLGVMMYSGARRVRHSILARLVADLGETCNLTMLHGAQVLYLDRMEAPWPLRLDLKPGSHVPVYCSASGKLLLAMQTREQRSVIVRALKLERLTPNTITDPELLDAELDQTARKRVAIDNEEFVVGIVCVATPVMDGRKRPMHRGYSRACARLTGSAVTCARIRPTDARSGAGARENFLVYPDLKTETPLHHGE